MQLLKRLAEAVTKRSVRRLLTDAYANPGGSGHRRIQRAARAWYGIDRCGPFHRLAGRWLVDFVFQVQQEPSIRDQERPFPLSPIGFDGLMIECRAGDANSSVVYLYGFSDNLTSFVLYQRYAKPGSIAVDVGANLGIHTLVLSRCVDRNGRVYAYEPLESIYRRLTANLAVNSAVNVVAKPYGLGEKTETIPFNDYAGAFNIGKGRFDPGGDGTMQVRTLDDELRGVDAPVSVIKIDVEGYELSVLKGAAETLRRHRPVLLIEYNPDAYRLAEFSACLPYPVWYASVPVTCWGVLEPVEPESVRHRVDLLITPA